MKNLVIFGGSGIGMIAANIAEEFGGYHIKGFLNDELKKDTLIGKYKKYPVIGSTNDYKHFLLDKNNYFFIAYVGMNNGKKTYEKISGFEIARIRYATLIHPTAIIPWDYVEIGDGVLMAPVSQLSPDVSVSDNCIMLGNSFLGHDSKMDRFAHIATNGVVGANVELGKGVHVGSNATIREKVKVGDFSLIGSGSVVLEDVPSNIIVIGNPARSLKVK